MGLRGEEPFSNLDDRPKSRSIGLDEKSFKKRYELFGWDYEYRNPLIKEEVAWYREFALQSGGPILELACGTGRLLVSLAREG